MFGMIDVLGEAALLDIAHIDPRRLGKFGQYYSSVSVSKFDFFESISTKPS